jgi:hypothetical protein
MSSEQTLQKLRTHLMSLALQAREDSIDKKNTAASKGKAEVEQVLESLEALYRKDPELFDPAVLAEIRTAKVCVGLISRSDLEQLENEPQKKAVVSAHKAFLKKHRIGHKGTRLGFTTRAEPICYVCNRSNDGSIDLECNICGWVICSCGACGCGLAKEEKAAKSEAAK